MPHHADACPPGGWEADELQEATLQVLDGGPTLFKFEESAHKLLALS